jgi:LPXTG-motif cell wall-anchored protein
MTAVAGVAIAATVSTVAPAYAHSELQPDTAAAGETADVTLFVENERSDAGTVEVQLFFPETSPVVLAALPATAGWTTSIDGGQVGDAVKSVTWTRPSAEPEDVTLPLTLGPLPPTATRLQFKLLQTYAGGDTDAWVQDWPEGAPEPDRPGPVLQVTGTAVAATSSTTSSAAPTTTTTVADTPPTTAGAAASPDGDSGSNAPIAIVAGGIVVAALAGGGFLAFRRRRAQVS